MYYYRAIISRRSERDRCGAGGGGVRAGQPGGAGHLGLVQPRHPAQRGHQPRDGLLSPARQVRPVAMLNIVSLFTIHFYSYFHCLWIEFIHGNRKCTFIHLSIYLWLSSARSQLQPPVVSATSGWSMASRVVSPCHVLCYVMVH